MKIKYLVLFLAYLSFAVNGCATNGGIITSLEGLTTEYNKEGMLKIPQYRIVSVPGLLPNADVGSLKFYIPKRNPSAAIGLSNDKSYILESIIESECDETYLKKIENELLQLKSLSEDFVSAKIRLTELTFSNRDKTTIDSENDRYISLRNDLNSKYIEVINMINKNGILIYRWDSVSAQKGGVGLGPIMSTSGTKEERYSGFAIISGLRIANLYVSKDIIEPYKMFTGKDNTDNRLELTTYIMQTKHILYISEYDLSAMAKARIEASYAQIANLPETLKKLDQIEIEAVLSKVANLSNMGIIGKAKWKTIDMDWTKPSEKVLMRLEGWQNIYKVESSFKEIVDMLKNIAPKEK